MTGLVADHFPHYGQLASHNNALQHRQTLCAIDRSSSLRQGEDSNSSTSSTENGSAHNPTQKFQVHAHLAPTLLPPLHPQARGKPVNFPPLPLLRIAVPRL